MNCVKFMLKSKKITIGEEKVSPKPSQISVASKCIFFSNISVNNKTQTPQVHRAEEIY